MAELHDKWTVRNVSIESIQRLKEVAFYNGLNISDCLDEAVTLWYTQLEADTVSPSASISDT